MMWNAGEGGVEGELFTGINYNTYFPPAGKFCGFFHYNLHILTAKKVLI